MFLKAIGVSTPKSLHKKFGLILAALVFHATALSQDTQNKHYTEREKFDIRDFERTRPSTNVKYITGCGAKKKAWDPNRDPAYKTSANKVSEKDTLVGQVNEIFSEHCTKCHNPQEKKGGIANLLDLPFMEKAGHINRKSPLDSGLLYQIESGNMPQDGTLSEQDKGTVKKWLEQGARGLSSEQAEDYGFISEEDKELCIKDDLNEVAELDRPFMKYLTLTHLYNSDKRSTLPAQREAISMLINSLSTNPEINKPDVIDPTGTILRIDLRKYGLTQASWDLISNVNPYGVKSGSATYNRILGLSKDYKNSPESKSGFFFGGILTATVNGQPPPGYIPPANPPPSHDKTEKPVKDDRTVNTPPFVRGDWFVFRASRPPLYYDLLDLPGRDRKPGADKQLELALGIDTSQRLANDDVTIATFKHSNVSDNNRQTQRFSGITGYYYKSLDTATNIGDQNLLEHPFDGKPNGGEIIFSLPNGMQAYMLIDAEGRRLDEAPTNIVKDKNRHRGNGAVINGLSCMNCHSRGMIDTKDDLRKFLLSDPHAFAGKRDEQLKILATHKPLKEQLAELGKDRNRFETSLEQTKYRPADTKPSKVSPPVPVFQVSQDFEEPLDLGQVAAELGMTPKELEAALVQSPDLRKVLALGGNNTIPRDTFNNEFEKVLDILQIGEFIRPTQQDFEIARLGNEVDGLNNRIVDLGAQLRRAIAENQKNEVLIKTLIDQLNTVTKQRDELIAKFQALGHHRAAPWSR